MSSGILACRAASSARVSEPSRVTMRRQDHPRPTSFCQNTTFVTDFPAFMCLSPHCGHLISVCRTGKCIDLSSSRLRRSTHRREQDIRSLFAARSSEQAPHSLAPLSRHRVRTIFGHLILVCRTGAYMYCTTTASSSVPSPNLSFACLSPRTAATTSFVVSDKGEVSTERVDKRADP